MILGDDSPLRRLPPHMDRRQALFFDGIRFTIEMADMAHCRLRETLYRLTNGFEQSSQEPPLTVSGILDAWSIVDSIHRLRGLLSQVPGIKQRSRWPSLRKLEDDAAEVEKFRNAVQHMNNKINANAEKPWPVWGVLSWFTMNDPNGTTGTCCTLVAGTVFSGTHPVVNPLSRKTWRIPVDIITLTAVGHSICLSDIMEHVQGVAMSLERALAEQFVNLPKAGADLIFCLGMSFGARAEEKKS